MKFIVGFLRQWADVDWVPTFDMVMTDFLEEEDQGVTIRTFRGTCTVNPD